MTKDLVLQALEDQKGDVVAGGELARAAGVSRTSIWKAIKALREDGNEIISVPNTGYKLLATNDTLSEKIISHNLNTKFLGRNLTLLPSVHSTNLYLKESDAAALENGHVVIADEQTGGRGRRGRPFLSAKGEGLYFSALLKLNGLQHDIRLLTICAAVAVSKAIENIFKIKAPIKWVNDIFLGGKKVCGILTEAIFSGELQELDTVVIGIGVNTGSVPGEIKGVATSIEQETGIRGVRNRLAAEILNQLESACLDYTENGKRAEILKDYESRLFIMGREVLVSSLQNDYAATVLGIDSTGALIVQSEAGVIQHLTSGEIRLCPQEMAFAAQARTV